MAMQRLQCGGECKAIISKKHKAVWYRSANFIVLQVNSATSSACRGESATEGPMPQWRRPRPGTLRPKHLQVRAALLQLPQHPGAAAPVGGARAQASGRQAQLGPAQHRETPFTHDLWQRQGEAYPLQARHPCQRGQQLLRQGLGGAQLQRPGGLDAAEVAVQQAQRAQRVQPRQRAPRGGRGGQVQSLVSRSRPGGSGKPSW